MSDKNIVAAFYDPSDLTDLIMVSMHYSYIYVVHLRDCLLSCQLQRAYALTFPPVVEGMRLTEL